VEQAARILLVARVLGGARTLGAEEVAELVRARGRYGVREGLAGCELPGPSALTPEEEALAERVAARVRKLLA